MVLLACFIELEKRAGVCSIHLPNLTMSREEKNMRTTAVGPNYLKCCHPFILQRPILMKLGNIQKVIDQRVKYQSWL